MHDLRKRQTPRGGRGRLHLGHFRDDEDEYLEAAKVWDRARIALALFGAESIDLLRPDAAKNSGRRLNFGLENYRDVVELLKGVRVPESTEALRKLIRDVALEKPLPQLGRLPRGGGGQ